jgi:hypothetical protein
LSASVAAGFGAAAISREGCLTIDGHARMLRSNHCLPETASDHHRT